MKNILSVITVAAISLGAAELKVDYSRQDKAAYPDFRAALNVAKDGDVVKIVKVDFPIRDAVEIKNRSNITVDGSFNTFSGVRKAGRNLWKQISPGLWKREVRLSQGIAMRYFMVINGRMERMGRFFKAKCTAAYKKVEELENNQWTIIADPASQNKNTFLYSIYLKLDPKFSSPAEAGVYEPQLSCMSGVALSGKSSGITIKNMICRNFWNDGYNIHGKVKSAVFDTICAIDCGDDGVSAHEDCEIDVKNYLSFGNSTGICHIDRAVSRHTDVYIESALGREIYLKSVPENHTTNIFKNVCVNSSSAGGVTLGAGAGSIDVENMTIVLSSGAKSFDHPGFRGGKSRISRLFILCKVPEKMLKFKADLLKKFQGEVEKELKVR